MPVLDAPMVEEPISQPPSPMENLVESAPMEEAQVHWDAQNVVVSEARHAPVTRDSIISSLIDVKMVRSRFFDSYLF